MRKITPKKMYRLKLSLLGAGVLLSWSVAQASPPLQAQYFTFQTRITDPSTDQTPTTAINVIFQILDPTGTCVLYTEEAADQAVPSTGVFIWKVGSMQAPSPDAAKRYTSSNAFGGTVPSTSNPFPYDAGNAMSAVYVNNGSSVSGYSASGPTTTSSCSVSYTPNSGDARVLMAYWAYTTSTTWNLLTPSSGEIISAVPVATVAETLAGLNQQQSQNLVQLGQNISGTATSSAVSFSSGITSSGTITGASITSTGTITLPTSSSTTPGTIWYDSTSGTLNYYDGNTSSSQTVGGASGIASLNGQTGSTQTFGTPGTTGTAPAWSSASNVHTLNIPMADTSGVTAGLLSNAEYSALLTSSGASSTYVPLAGGTMTGALGIGTSAASALAVTQSGSGNAATFMGGNIGIGTTNPAYNLDLSSSSNLVGRLSSSSGNANLDLVANGMTLDLYAGAYGRIWTAGAQNLNLGADSAIVETIASGGNVGIGTTSPTAALQIKAGTTTTAPLMLTAGTNLTTPVEGAIEFDGTSLYYTNSTPTRLTIATVGGNQTYSGNDTFSGAVDISNSTASSSTSTGALQIAGGEGLAGALNVGGATSIAGATSITNSTASSSDTTGALTVSGGAGVAGALNVGGATSIAGATSVTNTTASTSDTTGALLVSGGEGVTGAIYAGGAINSSSTMNASTSMTTPIIYGSSVASGTLTLDGTSNATAGNVLLDPSGGNVGIGTPSPQQPLDIYTASNAFNEVRNTNTTTGTSSGAGFKAVNDTGSSAALNKYGSTNSTTAFGINLANWSVVGDDSSGSGLLLSAAGTSSPVAFVAGAAERMRIISSGNIGVGTTSPSQLFHVYQNTASTDVTALVQNDYSGNGAYLKTSANSNYSNFQNSGTGVLWTAGQVGNTSYSVQDATDSTVPFVISKGASSNSLVINSSGNVGVGTTSPSAAFQIKAGTTTTAPLMFTAGTNLTTPVSGAIEYDGTNLYFTNSTPTRLTLATVGGSQTYSGNNTYSGTVDISNSTTSSSDTTGALQVAGGEGLGGALNVGGATSIAGATSITAGTASSSDTTGSLLVTGGEGITGAINAGGAINSSSTMSASTSLTTPIIYGSNAASGTLTLDGTSNATPGNVLINPSGGNVGIGTTSPSSPLTVGASTTTTNLYPEVFVNTTGNKPLMVGDTGSGNGIIFGYSGNDIQGRSPTTFGGNGDLILNEWGGDVGIGTSAPAANLDVRGSPSNSDLYIGTTDTTQTAGDGGAIAFGNWLNGGGGAEYAMAKIQGITESSATNTNGGSMIFSTVNGSPAMIERMRINSSGYVGIGTTNPQYLLDVNGTVRYYGVVNSSDIRLKKNIKPLTDSLAKVLELKGVSYNWKDPKQDPGKQLGFIAQDVEKVFPELVKTGKDGMKAVNYQSLIAPVAEAIKSLYAKLTHTDERVARLESENAALTAKVESLEQQSSARAPAAVNAQIDALKARDAALTALICQDHPNAQICTHSSKGE